MKHTKISNRELIKKWANTLEDQLLMVENAKEELTPEFYSFKYLSKSIIENLVKADISKWDAWEHIEFNQHIDKMQEEIDAYMDYLYEMNERILDKSSKEYKMGYALHSKAIYTTCSEILTGMKTQILWYFS